MKTIGLIGILLFFTQSYADPIFISIPSNGSVITTSVSNPGQYDIIASGTFNWGSDGTITLANAEWMFHSAEHQEWQEDWSSNKSHSFSIWGTDTHDLQVNNQFIHWEGLQLDNSYQVHTYSEQHIYKTTLFIESEVTFRIYDTDYHDNFGSLNIGVSKSTPVPEPSTFCLFTIGFCFLVAKRKRQKIL